MESRPNVFLDDRESLEEIVRGLLPRALDEYDSYGALSIEAGFQGRKLVVYTLKQGAPTNMNILTLGTFRVDEYDGPFFSVDYGGQGQEVGVLPVKVPGRDVFLQVPQNFIFKWKGKPGPSGVQFAPHYAVLIKTKSREHLQVDGDTYCVTLNKFRERFPKVPIRY